MKKVKLVFYAAGLIILSIIGLFFIRLILPSQVDDVNPLMNCSKEILDLADVYYVVPKFQDFDISNNLTWCKEIKIKNKSLALHGVYHTYEEFAEFRSDVYLQEGIDIFEKCFGVTPTNFKPGQLAWTAENDWIKEKMEVELFWNQLFHKVYHCNDTGKFSNRFVRFY